MQLKKNDVLMESSNKSLWRVVACLNGLVPSYQLEAENGAQNSQKVGKIVFETQLGDYELLGPQHYRYQTVQIRHNVRKQKHLAKWRQRNALLHGQHNYISNNDDIMEENASFMDNNDTNVDMIHYGVNSQNHACHNPLFEQNKGDDPLSDNAKPLLRTLGAMLSHGEPRFSSGAARQIEAHFSQKIANFNAQECESFAQLDESSDLTYEDPELFKENGNHRNWYKKPRNVRKNESMTDSVNGQGKDWKGNHLNSVEFKEFESSNGSKEISEISQEMNQIDSRDNIESEMNPSQSNQWLLNQYNQSEEQMIQDYIRRTYGDVKKIPYRKGHSDTRSLDFMTKKQHQLVKNLEKQFKTTFTGKTMGQLNIFLDTYMAELKAQKGQNASGHRPQDDLSFGYLTNDPKTDRSQNFWVSGKHQV
jgi:hypothetical protein